jgi:hypothetical protein
MITVKLKNILSAKESLSRLGNESLPIKLSYRLSKLIKRINDELKLFDENRSKIFNRYKDSEGTRIPDENIIEFNRTMSELVDIEINIDLNPLDLTDLVDKLNLSAFDLINLDGFVIVDIDN